MTVMEITGNPGSYSSPSAERPCGKASLLTPTTLSCSDASFTTANASPTSPQHPVGQLQQPAHRHVSSLPSVHTFSSSGGSPYMSSNSHHNNRGFRVALPSPSRPRLNPQYAVRLAQNLRSPSSSSMGSNSTGLIPPPGITRDRDESIFRPSPIVTAPSPQIEFQLLQEHLRHPTTTATNSMTPSTNATTGVLPESHRHFFQTTAPTPSVSRRSFYASSSSFGNAGSTPNSSSGSVSNMSPASRRAYSRRHSADDLGTSDRFIPSRATSNFHVNLWDGIQRTSTRSPYHFASHHSNAGSSHGSLNSNNHHPAHNNNHASPNDPNGADRTGVNGPDGTDPAAAAAAADASAISHGRDSDVSSTNQQNLLNVLLRSELLGENLNPFASSHVMSGSSYAPSSHRSGAEPLREGGNHLHFHSPRQAYQSNIYDHTTIGPTSVVNSFSLTPVRSAASQRLMSAPQKRKRRISKVPFKVLDAPALQDDFYLNLVDWSSQNVLAVGLGSCVYLWSACTSKVTKLCDLAQSEDIVTSVSWAQRGTHLAVGTNRGEVLLWDTIKCKKVRTMAGHSARVGTLAWTGPMLASGSRDRLIYLRDVRVQASFTDRLAAHKQEVCGLKWSFDEPAFLASGGNDNQLHVVDSRNPSQPVQRFSDHTAAVKAIAWSPHQHGLLASGGGTADRCIKFWNTLSGTALNSVDTGSQVCNLAWSQNCNEIVSTHGYSLNQIVVWRYPSMSKVVTLTGHTFRVLYLAMSPDGSTIVTGAGDETLRFWQVFPGPRSDSKNSAGGLLFPNTLGSVIR